MEKTFVLGLILLSSIYLVDCDIQTGSIDINRQMGNLEFINQYDSTLCYTQLFARPFIRAPSIATSLTQFSTEAENSYQIQIRIRKIELENIKAKFMVFARKEISIWAKIVFGYLATDREDFAVGVVELETTDLAGCGTVTQQSFQIDFNKKLLKPKVSVFLNGFDLQGSHSHTTKQNFQIELDIKSPEDQQKQKGLVLLVKRSQQTQVYSVSVSYIAMFEIQSDKGYSLQILYDSPQLQNLQDKSPYIEEIPHKANIKHAKFMIGFQKFKFFVDRSQDHSKTIIKSLAILMDEQSVKLGSQNSTYLQNVRLSYYIIKQSLTSCQKDEITSRNPTTRWLECKKCHVQKYQVPNTDNDECICMQGYYLINEKCYKKPQNSQWVPDQSAFICEPDYIMIFKKEKDQYLCKKIPEHMLLDSVTNQLICLAQYYQVSEEVCVKIPENGYLEDEPVDPTADPKKKKKKILKCKQDYYLISGQCAKPGQNQEYDLNEKKFKCKDFYFKVDGICIMPFPNSHYSETQKNFICNSDYYMKQPAVCQKIPDTMQYDLSQNKLVCKKSTDPLYFIASQSKCLPLPATMVYNPQTFSFGCPPKQHLSSIPSSSQHQCRQAKQNEQWSQKIQQFVCIQGAYRIDQQCLKPRPNTRFESLRGKFVCINGFYQIGGTGAKGDQGECKKLPESMKYDEVGRKFVCLQAFEQVEDQGKVSCLLIPQNMQYSKSEKRFICKPQFFFLKSSKKCSKPSSTQTYSPDLQQFICIADNYRIGSQCRPLPLNSDYLPEKLTFQCKLGYYQKGDFLCEKCKEGCASCKSANKCVSCLKGYEQEKVTGGQPGVRQTKCLEVCGDGIRFNDQCDDGNTDDKDGCSSKCKKQPNFQCLGGSSTTPDKCQNKKPMATFSLPPKSTEIRMIGMSHLYGKIILNIKLTYLPAETLSSYSQLSSLFRILTNSKLPLKTSIMYIDYSENHFVIVYDFNRMEPLPEYITRVEIMPEMKEKYFANCQVKSLFVRVNPAFMALRDEEEALG